MMYSSSERLCSSFSIFLCTTNVRFLEILSRIGLRPLVTTKSTKIGQNIHENSFVLFVVKLIFGLRPIAAPRPLR
jgi:hypothetical protein